MRNSPQPFSSFGLALKTLRENNSKSQAEVSGAVEIEQNRLIAYEEGKSRPSEDILILLIQHFNLKDNEARELWRLAGYDNTNYDDTQYFTNDQFGEINQAQQFAIPTNDPRIVYTDMIQVMINNYGVIINFMQGAGVGSQPLAVAKVGMSKEHVKSVVDVLTKTLEQAENIDKNIKHPKRLTSGNQNKE